MAQTVGFCLYLVTCAFPEIAIEASATNAFPPRRARFRMSEADTMPVDGHRPERPPYATAPPADTLGTRHVIEALRDLDFPMTTRQIVERAGAWRMPITGAHFHTLADMMRGVPARTFRSPRSVADAIERENAALRR